MLTITTLQELHRRAFATGFVLAQGTHRAKNKKSLRHQRENQIKQCNEGKQSLQIDIMHRHHAKRVFLVKKTLSHRNPGRLSRTTSKPPREPQGYQRYHTSGRGTTAIQIKKRKQPWLTSILITITTLQELHR